MASAPPQLRVVPPASEPEKSRAPGPDGDRRTHARRMNKRLRVSKKVEYEFEGRRIFGFTKDISGTGVFIRTSRTLPVGSVATFWLGLDNAKEPLVVKGTVIRVRSEGADAGMGVAYNPSSAVERVERFVLDTLEEIAKRQLGNNARNTRALREIGEICEEKHEPDEALKHYSAVLAIEPNAADMKGRVGLLTLVHAEAGSDELEVVKAMALLEEACASDERNQDWKEGLAHARQLLEKVHGKRTQDEQRFREEGIAQKLDMDRQQAEVAEAMAALAKAQVAHAEAEEGLKKAKAEHARDAEALAEEKWQVAAEQKLLRRVEKDLETRVLAAERLEAEVAAHKGQLERRGAQLDQQAAALADEKRQFDGAREVALAAEEERAAARAQDEAATKAAFTAREARIEETEGALHKEQRGLEETRLRLNQEQSDLAAKAKQLGDDRSALAVEQGELLRALAAERAELHGKMEEAKTQVAERERQVEEGKRELADTAKSQNEAQESNARLEQALASQAQRLSDERLAFDEKRTAAIQELEKELAERRDQIAEQEQRHAERVLEREKALAQAVEEREAQRALSDQLNAELAEALTKAVATEQSGLAAIAKLSAELSDVQAKAVATEQSGLAAIAKLTAELSDVQAQAVAAEEANRAAIAQAKAELDAAGAKATEAESKGQALAAQCATQVATQAATAGQLATAEQRLTVSENERSAAYEARKAAETEVAKLRQELVAEKKARDNESLAKDEGKQALLAAQKKAAETQARLGEQDKALSAARLAVSKEKADAAALLVKSQGVEVEKATLQRRLEELEKEQRVANSLRTAAEVTQAEVKAALAKQRAEAAAAQRELSQLRAKELEQEALIRKLTTDNQALAKLVQTPQGKPTPARQIDDATPVAPIPPPAVEPATAVYDMEALKPDLLAEDALEAAGPPPRVTTGEGIAPWAGALDEPRQPGDDTTTTMITTVPHFPTAESPPPDSPTMVFTAKARQGAVVWAGRAREQAAFTLRRSEFYLEYAYTWARVNPKIVTPAAAILLIVCGWLILRPHHSPARPPVLPAQRARVQETSPAAPVLQTAPEKSAVAAAPEPAPSVPAVPALPDRELTPPPMPTFVHETPLVAPRAPAPARKAARKPAAAAGDALGNIFSDEVDAKAVSINQTTLRVDRLVNAARKHASDIEACLRQARAANAIDASTYNVEMTMVIQPAGTVSAAKLLGPVNARPAAACFTKATEQWRFDFGPEPVTLYKVGFGPMQVK